MGADGRQAENEITVRMKSLDSVEDTVRMGLAVRFRRLEDGRTVRQVDR